MDRTDASEARTTFQTFAPWSPRTHVPAGAAMVYGIDPTLPGRMRSWRERGYDVQVMTGVSWGQYQDYLYGRFDGKNHEDEAQTDRDGNRISHGGDVYYMSPGDAYGRFLCVGVQRALEAGATALCLEEPEFWVRAGYEPAFRRAWLERYGEPWQPPHASVDAQWRASLLKAHLYRRALAQVFDFVRAWGERHGRRIPCTVASHSPINYAHWRIVSPESSLLEVGCDGYIAQVWTGTARTPNVHRGVLRERTFETALLEYGSMANLVKASRKPVWLLNDPIEDNPDHGWDDYRANWENTLVASLLQTDAHRYEVLPWPDRIFERPYRRAEKGPDTDRVPIPPDYETELQSVFHALGDMDQPRVRWERAGSADVGILFSDTMMFQRGGPSPSDPHLGSFYGLALPLVKAGVPLAPVQIENATAPGFLKSQRLLLLTYEGQKPPDPALHAVLADWVRRGGCLVVVDDDADPFHAVRAWWNAPPLALKTPRHHLFDALKLPRDATGLRRVGKGCVLRLDASPAALSYRSDGADTVLRACRDAREAVGRRLETASALVLRRGPYVVAAGIDESREAPAAPLAGRFVALFDPQLAVVGAIRPAPGTRGLFVDLDALPRRSPRLVAAACAVRDWKADARRVAFRAEGIDGSAAVVRVALPWTPKTVRVAGRDIPFDTEEGTVRLRFVNRPSPQEVEIRG